jgi:starch synthase
VVVVDGRAMEILLVRSELGPWIGSSDGAEALGVYAKTLRQLGHDVTILAVHHPAYEQKGLLVARRLSPLILQNGRAVTVYDAQLSTGVKLVLFGLPQTAVSWLAVERAPDPDNLDAAATLGHAVAAMVAQRALQANRFDVVHLYDWCTALAAVALRDQIPECPRIVLSVSDVTQVGGFTVSEAAIGELDPLLADARVACASGLSLLKAGVLAADVVVVSSERRVNELRLPGEGSAVVPFSQLGERLVAITEGVDYARINPATSPALVAHYDAFDTTGKSITKTAYLRECGFELEEELPLLLVPGPLNQESGSDVAATVLGVLDPSQVRVVVLGTAQDDPEMVARFDRLVDGHLGHYCVRKAGDTAEFMRALGAADLVLLTTPHEPVGVRHLMAMRCGAAPIASAVGAHLDTIVDADATLSTGHGFLFASGEEALAATQRGIAALALGGWSGLRRRIMRLDVSWDRPARRMVQLYRQAASVSVSADVESPVS